MVKDEQIRLLAVGDIMLGDHPVCIGHGVRSQMDKKGMDYPFRLVSSLLKQGDITFANLEAVLSDTGFDPDCLIKAELRGRSAYSMALAEAGFTVMAIANNHIMQHGEKAFQETVRVLQKQGVFCIGLRETDQKSNVFEFCKADLRVALISYSLRPEKYFTGLLPYAFGEECLIIEQVRELAGNFDAVIVSLHWGAEYVNYPSADQITLGHKIIDAGASLILGHHPHVLQGIEKYKGGFIVYSLGNFIFDKWQKNPRETIILDCRIGKGGIKKLSWLPVMINRQFQPQIVVGDVGRLIERKLENYSAWIENANLTEATADSCKRKYNKMTDRAYLRFRLSSYLYFLTHLYLYSPKMIKQSLHRAFYRKISG